MKNFREMWVVVVGLVWMVLPTPVVADTLTIPHNKGDKVIIHTYPDLYAHPVDYWWYQYGALAAQEWDYYREVKHYDQPIKLNPMARLPNDYRMVNIGGSSHTAVPHNNYAD